MAAICRAGRSQRGQKVGGSVVVSSDANANILTQVLSTFGVTLHCCRRGCDLWILLPIVVRRQARQVAKRANPTPECICQDHGAHQAIAPEAVDDLDDLGDPKDLAGRLFLGVL
ncbi:hypothetical protein E2562_021372 [Oryza meyeriana var. granulata]|uniref:Uncharacterized protein n=1 Tax=Oryza meyeriana var. granulata TaxID=110450 RepID=A0A6G1CIU5_9ORYZ|nr:hypothetical protein E2562_021372 [Oryza meyeriana var. granulata]